MATPADIVRIIEDYEAGSGLGPDPQRLPFVIRQLAREAPLYLRAMEPEFRTPLAGAVKARLYLFDILRVERPLITDDYPDGHLLSAPADLRELQSFRAINSNDPTLPGVRMRLEDHAKRFDLFGYIQTLDSIGTDQSIIEVRGHPIIYADQIHYHTKPRVIKPSSPGNHILATPPDGIKMRQTLRRPNQ